MNVPPRLRRKRSGIGVLVGTLLLAHFACSAEERPGIAQPGAGGASSSGASTASASSASHAVVTAVSSGDLTGGGYLDVASSSSSSGGGGPCVPPPAPEGVPEGWVAWTDYACTCPLYVPGSKEVMPPPIEWEACPPMPDGVECRAMKIAWSDDHTPIAVGSLQFDTNPDGSAVLPIRRIHDKYVVNLVADADGEVRSALLLPLMPDQKPGTRTCYTLTESYNEGRYVLGVNGHDLFGDHESNERGAIGGSIDDPSPTLLTRFTKDDPFGVAWKVSKRWVVRNYQAKLTAHSWDFAEEHFVTSAATDPGNMRPHRTFVRGDAVFWQTASLGEVGVNVWTLEGGAKPFLRWPGDFTKGASDFDTDGVHMVWAYGEGKKPEDLQPYPTRSIMVAPFTTDPGAIQPKRLRSAPFLYVGEDLFRVGCGFAIHRTRGEGPRKTAVVRLSDGWMWEIPATDQFEQWDVVGVTCEEAFVLAKVAGRANIARVRLDSLGPGLPPD